MRKADYQKIAKTYDVSRPLYEQNLELWLDIISKKIGMKDNVIFLDLGCGTGRFSIPIASNLGYLVTGADSSNEMILKAKRKEGSENVNWDIQNAMVLSYSDKSFDAVFMSHLLHHVDYPFKVVEECYRILKNDGLVFNRYGAWDNICDDPEHRFFPEAKIIDKARIPKIKQVEEWFKKAGFQQVSSQDVKQESFKSPEDRLEKTKLKNASVLTMIDQSDFEEGIYTFQNYITSNPNDPWILQDTLTITTGRK